MEFKESAFKHGFSSEEIAHAMRNAWRIFDLDDGVTLFLGPTKAGNVLEILTNKDGAIFHAMSARPKFFQQRW